MALTLRREALIPTKGSQILGVSQWKYVLFDNLVTQLIYYYIAIIYYEALFYVDFKGSANVQLIIIYLESAQI